MRNEPVHVLVTRIVRTPGSRYEMWLTDVSITPASRIRRGQRGTVTELPGPRRRDSCGDRDASNGVVPGDRAVRLSAVEQHGQHVKGRPAGWNLPSAQGRDARPSLAPSQQPWATVGAPVRSRHDDVALHPHSPDVHRRTNDSPGGRPIRQRQTSGPVAGSPVTPPPHRPARDHDRATGDPPPRTHRHQRIPLHERFSPPPPHVVGPAWRRPRPERQLRFPAPRRNVVRSPHVSPCPDRTTRRASNREVRRRRDEHHRDQQQLRSSAPSQGLSHDPGHLVGFDQEAVVPKGCR